MVALASELPNAFRAPRVLRNLNVVAVGFSLAACAGVVFAGILGSTFSSPPASAFPDATLTPGIASGLSTLVFGLIWARVARIRSGKFPVGWLLSVPLAALNAGTALGLVMAGEGSGAGFLGGVILGATFGAIFWIPALMVTLVCFGVPLHLAKKAADEGLGSEDRGERTVGVAAACFALLAIMVITGMDPHRAGEVLVLVTLAVIGVVTGTASAIYATARERSRRLFLSNVERGVAEGYRVTGAAGQPVLVRVTRTGEIYRGADLEEPLALLDESGDARRTLNAQST